jgi:CheY-like chemotaxis protein
MDRSRLQPREEARNERRILVVDDEPEMRALWWRLLPAHGWSVSTAGDGLTALQQIEGQSFDAVLADLRLPGPNGIRVLEHARLINPEARLVLFGGWLDEDARERARAIGAAAVTKGALESLELLLAILNET